MFYYHILAVDWGTKNIGLAFGNNQSKICVAPKKILGYRDLWPALDFIFGSSQHQDTFEKYLFPQAKIDTLVLGYPTNFSLKQTKNSKSVHSFAQQIIQKYSASKTQYKNPLDEFSDEKYTGKGKRGLVGEDRRKYIGGSSGGNNSSGFSGASSAILSEGFQSLNNQKIVFESDQKFKNLNDRVTVIFINENGTSQHKGILGVKNDNFSAMQILERYFTL